MQVFAQTVTYIPGSYNQFLFSIQFPFKYVCIGTFMYVGIHVIYVTWAGVICPICMHKHKGAQRLRASADISGKSRLRMLHMLCNTSGLRKTALHCIGKDGAFDYGM